MKDYDKNKESSYLKYWNVNALYGLSMTQKLPVNNFEWIKDTFKSNEDFIKNITKKVMKDNFLKLMYNILKKLGELRNKLQFLPGRIKIEKGRKLVANLHDKTEYVVYIRNLKQTLNDELVFKNIHRVIKFNQNDWLKLFIDINRGLRKKAKIDFQKCFFKMMNNAVFVFIKIGDIYEDIPEDVETRFDTSNYEFERPFLKGKSKKSNWIN